jgi:hypothetical protein
MKDLRGRYSGPGDPTFGLGLLVYIYAEQA